MTASLDLNILPLYRHHSQDLADLPGLHVADRPRRAARSRSSDQLILYVSFTGEAALPDKALTTLLGELSRTYYKVSGSVTSALREVAEALNAYLFKLNQQNAGSGPQITGYLSQIVRRDGQIYLAQSGPLHAYIISASGVVHEYDPDRSGPGLGLNAAAAVRYFHAALESSDTLLMAVQPLPGWDEATLSAIHGQGPESTRRRLLAGALSEVRAFIVQARPGKGELVLLRSGSTATAVGTPEGSQALSDAPLPRPAVGAGVVAVTAAKDIPAAQSVEITPALSDAVAPTSGDVESTRQGSCLGSIGSVFKFVLYPFAMIFQSFASLFNRIIPGETLASIPSSTMAFIALAVPILIVGVATVVYIQRGMAAQSEVVYSQALELVREAEGETDLLAQRSSWKALIDHLAKAEIVYPIPELDQLQEKAQNKVDELDMVRRVDFQPAIFGGLPASANVKRIVIGDDEVYLLDGNGGHVYHATLTNQGYMIDEDFACGPGAPGVDEPIIDIVSWPAGFEPGASILGLSANGDVVYCMPGQAPIIGQLAKPVSSDLTDLAGFSLDLGNLYVLDPESNAVWIYWDSDITQSPQIFFGDQVPPMDDVVDLVVNNNDLYLLHADGHMTLCQFSWLEVSPTRCTEPVMYLDTRPGRENSALIPENPFSQILYNPPPDPSLYLLDPVSRSIYHFSLRSPTFQREYMPVELTSNASATAFAFDSFERIFFLATGNDVYYVRLP